MVIIALYGDVNETGGSKVVLQDGDACCSFDFGASFGRGYDYYEEYLKPRPAMGLLDILYMGLLPPLEGVYREDLVPGSDFWAQWRLASHYRRLTLDAEYFVANLAREGIEVRIPRLGEEMILAS